MQIFTFGSRLYFLLLLKAIGFLGVLFSVFIFSCKAKANFFILDQDSLRQQSANQINSHLEADLNKRLVALEALVPPRMKNSFSGQIVLKFDRLAQDNHGKSDRKMTMTLNENLISDFYRNTQHDSLFNRTILHELAHLYDALGIISEENRQLRQTCLDRPVEVQRQDPQCLFWRTFSTSVSTDPFYFTKAGWIPKANSLDPLMEKNSFSYRSPDEYELKSSREHFAVNFEYFATDKLYKCRRPTLFRYFKRHFDFDPFPFTQCEEIFYFVQPGDSNPPFKEIDLKRLYKIDYLFAQKGEAMMSRWGHSMLRLVICAPNKPLNDDCYGDIKYHVVISFRAFINTPTINVLGGLTSEYPSRLFFLPLSSVLLEYNQQELRDLRALPLKLSPEEMKMLVEKAIETHWSYSGSYNFTSNNCATETFNLLRAALNRENLFVFNPLQPKDLWEVLVVTQLADSSYNEILSDPLRAKQKGLLYESFAPRLKLALKKLKIDLSFDQYKILDFKNRQILTELNGPSTGAELAGLLILEESAYKWKLSQIIQRLSGSLLEEVNKGGKAQMDFKLNLDAFGVLSAPYLLLLPLSDSYGLPSIEEREKISLEIRQHQKTIAALKDQNSQSEKEIRTDSENQELNWTSQNIKKYYQILSDRLTLTLSQKESR